MDVFATGENMIFGKVGHFLVILSFIASLLSGIFYARASRRSDDLNSLQLGRQAYLVHSFSVLGAIAILLTMISFHLFEYSYVWRSSNNALPMRYLFSSFWEGQEGSTMLWMFWHVIIGIILIFRAREWEAPVMMVVAFVQAMLGSMLLGVIVFGYKMGANPFALLRDTMDIPIFKMNPDFIPEDGSGLNPLLQNYWMTIHPPTMFFGYALTVVPFAYAVASLMKRSYTDWIKPVLPWVLGVVLVLGTGLLMGGAWAYESLSFGGFWAWDPVENASLVPWLIAVAGLHTLYAFKHRGYSLSATYILLIFSFLTVLYSSFLTKSGILGDSSVHSFTDMGMSGQLVFMMAACFIPGIGLWIYRYRELPTNKQEEATSSREFWLFIGSMVFVLSAVHVAVMTSFPVFNKILGTSLAPPSDVIKMYNDVQIWVAILLGLIMAVAQHFNYKKTSISKLKALIVPVVLSIAITIPIIIGYEFYRISEALMAWTSILAIVANSFYLIIRIKGNWRNYGGSLSHVGFALMLIGILISQGRQYVVSYNQFGIDYGETFTDEDNAENILLYKDETAQMADYKLTYLGDSIVENKIYYRVHYEPLADGKSSFTLEPHLQIDSDMGNVANPSTRRTLTSDLFTHITAAPITEEGEAPDSIRKDIHIMKVGDTIRLSRSIAILDGINPIADAGEFVMGPEDLAVGAQLRYITLDSTYQVEPVYLIQNRIARSIPLRVEKTKTNFVFSRILPETAEIELTTEQEFPRYIIMKAIVFPYINLLWSGAIIMILGIAMSIRKHVLRNRQA